MDLNLSETMKQLITALLLIVLPWVVIGIGLAVNVQNVWFYILSVLWFGLGAIFFQALN